MSCGTAQLVEKLISPATDPLLCRRAALAGLLVRLGFALLEQIELPAEEPPSRDLAQPSSLRSFRRGDRLHDGGPADEWSTDPTSRRR